MIFIDNLSAFLQEVICVKASGIYVPQNSETVNTTQLVTLIAEASGKKMRTSKAAGNICRQALQNIPIFKKTFGNLVFEKENTIKYEAVRLADSIWQTEWIKSH